MQPLVDCFSARVPPGTRAEKQSIASAADLIPPETASVNPDKLFCQERFSSSPTRAAKALRGAKTFKL